MGGRKDLARLQAELDKICAGNGDAAARRAREAQFTDSALKLFNDRLSAFEAEIAALSARKPLHSDGGSDVPPTVVDAHQTDGSADDDGACTGADGAGAGRGGHMVIDMTMEDSDGGGDGAAPADGARAAPWQRPHKLHAAPRAAAPAHVRRTGRSSQPVLWPAFLPAARRGPEPLHLAPAQGGSAKDSAADLHAKLCLTAYHCTSADAALALLGSGRLRRGSEAQACSLAAALHAIADVGSFDGDSDANRTMVCKTTKALHGLRRKIEAGVRAAALRFRVACAGTADGTRPVAHHAFRRTTRGSRRVPPKLCPSPHLEQLVTFERLVLTDDGTLRLGPGSLLRCLAAGLVAKLNRPELLLMPGGTELRVTPALLAGLLFEAEVMCSPKNASLTLETKGVRLVRLRHMFDAYVRPLTQLPDGGGVLLPRAQVEAWLNGVGWLPAAFRVPESDLPQCLYISGRPARGADDHSVGAEAELTPRIEMCLAPGSSSDSELLGDADQWLQTTRRACRARSRPDDVVKDSGDDPSPATSSSWLSGAIVQQRCTRAHVDAESSDDSDSSSATPSSGYTQRLCGPGTAKVGGLGRPRNTPRGVSFFTGPECAAKLFLLTCRATRADVILALVGSGQLPGLKSMYKDVACVPAPRILDACFRAVRDVTQVSDRPDAANSVIATGLETVTNLERNATNHMRSAALRFNVGEAGNGRSQELSCRAFCRAAPSISGQGRLCPTKDAARLATFERLVQRPDTGLRFGAGSLLRHLAAAALEVLPRRVALLTGGDEEQIRLTPALLASILVEAEDMCTPVSNKQAFGASLARLMRTRHMYDAYVRPLMSLPDGGGVLLPQEYVAAWLPGVNWVPAAFRVPKVDITLCSSAKAFWKINDERRKRKRGREDDGTSGRDSDAEHHTWKRA